MPYKKDKAAAEAHTVRQGLSQPLGRSTPNNHVDLAGVGLRGV